MISGILILALLQAAAGEVVADQENATTTGGITVILPKSVDASMLEALSRLRGEAYSVGLDLHLAEAEADTDPRDQLTAVARRFGSNAVVALVATPEEAQGPTGVRGLRAMDVWFIDPSTGQTTVSNLTVEEEAPRANLVLAVRVVDFIRARMFDSLVRDLAANRANRSLHPPFQYELVGRRHVAIGLFTMGSFAGFDTAFLPSLGMGYKVKPWLRVALSLSGLGTKPRRESPNVGSVTFDQKLVQASAMFLSRWWWRLQPFAEVGGSVFLLSVRGMGLSGSIGSNPSGWSPGVHGAGGTTLGLSRHLALQLSAGAMLLVREQKVYVTDAEVARTGRPSWLAQALLVAAF